MYDLYSDFDMEKHKQTYVNYFEAVILPTGKVVYAIPSHQEKLISIGMDKFRCSRDDFINMCPREMYFDYLKWLCSATDCVAVWSDGILGSPNRFQKHKLEELKREGIYKGIIDSSISTYSIKL